jgi:hypothetical protein
MSDPVDRSVAHRAGRPASLLAASLCAAAALAGCDYDHFNVIVGRDFYVGTIMSHYSDIEVGNKRILLKPGARVAIKTRLLTQSVAQFDLNILAGDGLVAFVRTVPFGFDTTQGIALRYSTSGCWVRNEQMEIVPIEYNADAGPQTVKLYSDGELIRFDVGCRTLHEQTTALPGTEYVILEALPGSTVEILSMKFFLLDE